MGDHLKRDWAWRPSAFLVWTDARAWLVARGAKRTSATVDLRNSRDLLGNELGRLVRLGPQFCFVACAATSPALPLQLVARLEQKLDVGPLVGAT
jgi:hypothetical protein